MWALGSRSIGLVFCWSLVRPSQAIAINHFGRVPPARPAPRAQSRLALAGVRAPCLADHANVGFGQCILRPVAGSLLRKAFVARSGNKRSRLILRKSRIEFSSDWQATHGSWIILRLGVAARSQTRSVRSVIGADAMSERSRKTPASGTRSLPRRSPAVRWCAMEGAHDSTGETKPLSLSCSSRQFAPI
jgi:hypothetical protein